WHLVRVVARDVAVHLEEVAVAILDYVAPESLDGVAEIEVDADARRSDAASLVDHLLGSTRGDVARGEVAEARIVALEVVVALALGDVVGVTRVPLLQRHPDPPVVAQRLAHQRELGLVLTRGWNGCRVDLREAGVRETCPPLVRAPD